MAPPTADRKDRTQGSLASRCARWVAGALCLLWLAGCVSGIWNRKVNHVDKTKIASATNLIKPRVSEGTENQDVEKGSRWEKPGEDGKPAAETKPGPDLHRDKLPQPASRSDVKNSQSPPAQFSPKTSQQDGDTTSKRVPAKESVEERLKSPIDAGDTQGQGEGSFTKHNHVQYVELIEQKAREKLKDHRDVSMARMCKDSTTDQWTMNIYRKEPKSYSFISYAWDEVDQKWEKSFESRRQPITRWHSHLEFSAARKNCKVLKGSLNR